MSIKHQESGEYRDMKCTCQAGKNGYLRPKSIRDHRKYFSWIAYQTTGWCDSQKGLKDVNLQAVS